MINHKIKQKEQAELESLEQLPELAGGTRANSAEELILIRILSYQDRFFQVGKRLSEDRVAIMLSLVQNFNVFA